MTLEERLSLRSQIEELCELADDVLPIYESMLLRLHFSDGYSFNAIAQLLMKHPTTASRRIQKIVDKLKCKTGD